MGKISQMIFSIFLEMKRVQVQAFIIVSYIWDYLESVRRTFVL